MEANGHDPGRAVRLVRALLFLGGTMAMGAAPARAAGSTPDPVPIAVLDLDYIDTSGEVRDQRQEHTARLRQFSAALRSDLARSGKYRIVTLDCGPAPCATSDLQPSELIDRARKAGAKILLMGGIHKQSTLIQWAKVQAVDVDTDRAVWDKLLTFRGDTDEAWNRAEAFLSAELTALPSAR
jgi:hypothetical protein